VIVASFIVWTLLLADDAAARVGTLADPEIKEASGIVKSRVHEGVYWVHNDSGNPPALFAVREDGAVIRRYDVSVPNVDWEDIAADGAGHLYLGDIGNNGGRLPLRSIYRFDEPDPAQPADGPLRPTLAIYSAPPKDDRFDAESLVIDGDEALLITKRLDGRMAMLMSLPLDSKSTLLRPARPEPRGELPGFDEPATGADLSADGERLAVTSLRTVRIYRRDGGTWTPIGEALFEADGVEAVAWDGDDLVLAGEGRGIYRIPARSWRGVPAAKGPGR
jgi:hypothetical protein